MIAVVALALVGLAAMPPEDRERARALFEEAARAKSEARWADVRRLLQQSIEAYPQFSTAWNLVTADEELDDLPAAETLLIGLKNGAFGPLSAKELAAVNTRLEAVARELGSLAIDVGAAGAEVAIDGAPRGVADAEGRIELRVTAGSHIVVVRASDGRALERSVDVSRGDRRALRFSFPAPIAEAPPSAPALTLPAPAPAEESGSVFSSPWLWVVIGALAVGGAAGIIGAAASGPWVFVFGDFNVPPL